VPLGQTGGEREGFPNILLFEIREVGEQFGDSSAGGKRLDDHPDRYAHATDARLAAHDCGIEGYATELLHRVMIALGTVWAEQLYFGRV
jgi:hypothetical protein